MTEFSSQVRYQYKKLRWVLNCLPVVQSEGTWNLLHLLYTGNTSYSMKRKITLENKNNIIQYLLFKKFSAIGNLLSYSNQHVGRNNMLLFHISYTHLYLIFHHGSIGSIIVIWMTLQNMNNLVTYFYLHE